MPEKTTTAWTCSRCGLTETLDGIAQPPDWARLLTLCPPRSTVSADGTEVLGDLCKECVDALGYFLRNVTVSELRLDGAR